MFGRDVKTISKHINNALREELDDSTVAKFATVQYEGEREVGGVEFRKWANTVLKQYIIDGYAVNEKRLEALQKTVEIQTRMLSDVLSVDASEVLRAVNGKGSSIYRRV